MPQIKRGDHALAVGCHRHPHLGDCPEFGATQLFGTGLANVDNPPIADTQLTPPEPSGGRLVFGERPSQPSGVFAVRAAGMYR
jgi:hypothetical protein